MMLLNYKRTISLLLAIVLSCSVCFPISADASKFSKSNEPFSFTIEEFAEKINTSLQDKYVPIFYFNDTTEKNTYSCSVVRGTDGTAFIAIEKNGKRLNDLLIGFFDRNDDLISYEDRDSEEIISIILAGKASDSKAFFGVMDTMILSLHECEVMDAMVIWNDILDGTAKNQSVVKDDFEHLMQISIEDNLCHYRVSIAKK